MSDSDVNVDVTSTDNEKRPTPPARVYGLAARVDPTVTFEEFRYWAKLQRAEEREENLRYIEEQGPMTLSKMIKNRFSHGIHHERKKKEQKEAARREALQVTAESNGEQEQNPKQTAREETMTVTEEEWKTASRALKTAGWETAFSI
ncbi:hypothetical protein CIHG_09572 [Coccidioides immitis H538.4]|uniref:Uncharacterized protein n=1 Tax=Coccidioides immitis H538.4 TaxID=396776 RepID=A0A0J8S3V1_COCIT|nr:hypothetical protein CIHG_09572 [Coccidioides immitis H538.4]